MSVSRMSRPSSAVVVARRLSADIPDAPTEGACLWKFPENELKARMKQVANVTSMTSTIGGMTPTGDCCTKMNAFEDHPAPDTVCDNQDSECQQRVLAEAEDYMNQLDANMTDLLDTCVKELSTVTGVWQSVEFNTGGELPFTGASSFAKIDGPKYAEIMGQMKDVIDPLKNIRFPQDISEMSDEERKKEIEMRQQAMEAVKNYFKFGVTYAQETVDGFQKLSFSMSWAKTQASYEFKNYYVTKVVQTLTYDEAKMKALAIKDASGAEEAHDRAQMVAWHLFDGTAYAPNAISLSSKSTFVESNSASPSIVGSVSLVGSLALMGVVAGAFITRRRRQVRNIQNAEAATEMTSQEVA